VDTAEVWDQLLSTGERWGRLHFLDHRSEDAQLLGLHWIPDVEADDSPDAWHPEDALFAPLVASDGTRLGVLSVDLPCDGRRPNAAMRKALEAFAISTALAIEHATLRARAEASERRFQQLALQDSLTGVGNRPVLLERLHHALTRRPEARSLLRSGLRRPERLQGRQRPPHPCRGRRGAGRRRAAAPHGRTHP
jgi:hypothetical protein